VNVDNNIRAFETTMGKVVGWTSINLGGPVFFLAGSTGSEDEGLWGDLFSGIGVRILMFED
jgi:hypothetical protein